MGRNRVVQPGVVRHQIADVHRRSHEKLLTLGVEEAPGKRRPATTEEVAASADRLDEAVQDADWVELKADLSAGESREAFNRLVLPRGFDERAQVDNSQIGVSKILAYLTGWSICGADGQVLPYNLAMPAEERLATILSVDRWTYGEIDAVVDWHEEQVTAAREARKNVRAGEPKSSPTSPSAG
jgi:hypothetical protein